MKMEISIEEKARRYDEAYKKVAIRFGSNVADEIFSEYEESEDERIRKEMIGFITYSKILDETKKNWIAWLEKLGEQKPIEPQQDMLSQEKYAKAVDECIYGEQKPAWSEEDEVALGDALWCCKQAASIAKDENDMGNVWYVEHWLKSLKNRVQPQPKQEWSEEDRGMRMKVLKYLSTRCSVFEYEEVECWLNSLKERYTWKPSDEQIEALESATENCAYSEYQDCLRELIGKLKKLRKE